MRVINKRRDCQSGQQFFSHVQQLLPNKERERERETDRKTDRERERERERAYFLIKGMESLELCHVNV